MPIALIVHGGAWDIPDDEVDEHQAGCRQALEIGWQVLQAGGTALDAVEAAVRALEDAPIFDAGVGSVLNRDGDVELDAAVMDGATLRSGAVAAVRRVRNPITLARRVLESQVVLLVAQGAERFAAESGVPFCDPAELIVEREYQRWRELLAQTNVQAQDAFSARQAEDRDRRSRMAASSATRPSSRTPATPSALSRSTAMGISPRAPRPAAPPTNRPVASATRP